MGVDADTTIEILKDLIMPLAATFIGAHLAFRHNRKLERKKTTEQQLQLIFG